MKVTENNSDVETLEYDSIENKEYFKSMDIESLIEKLETYVENRYHKKFGKITLMDDVIIGFGKDAVVINQPGHKRIVTYRQKAYKINFPNAIYIMYHRANKICEINAYCYKDFIGKNTKLYKYAMPNMLTENRICIGTAPKEIRGNDYVEALEKVIFTQYTHDHTDNIKSFKETRKYFDYLSKNNFPYDLLIDANMTLQTAVK